MSATAKTTRLRKVECVECGYVLRVTRSWLTVGLPSCCCGGEIRPTDPADLAYVGLIGPDDMPARDWTAICRANGWDDAIMRKGAAAKAYEAKLRARGGILGDRRRGADHCAYPGCGRFVPDGAEHCAAGHAQRADLAPRVASDEIPF